MEMEDSIIMATENDREEILALYKAQIGRDFCPWTEEYPGNDTISFDLSRDSLFVMKREGRVAAAVSIDDDPDVNNLPCWNLDLAPGGELSRLCVLPELQNEGIARKMMLFGMEELAKRGFKSIHFLVNKYNVKAIQSHAALGCAVVGECHMYEQDFLCYEKALRGNLKRDHDLFSAL